MTQNVTDNALLLEVIAGADGLDPRQYDVQDRPLHGRGQPRRLGLAHRRRQGRLRPARRGGRCRREGARGGGTLPQARRVVEEVSVPMHLDGPAHLDADRAGGPDRPDDARQRHGHQLGGPLHHPPARAHANWRARADELRDTLKISHAGRRVLSSSTPRALLCQGAEPVAAIARGHTTRCSPRYDLLLMPTMPMKATPLAAGQQLAGAVVPARLRDAAEHGARST